MAQQLRLDFTNLPLIEVVARITFQQPIALTYSLINRLAELLRPEFPEMGELDGIEPVPGVPPVLSFSVQTLPGAVYKGATNGISLSIQNQLLAARWRRQITPGSAPYPRFGAIEHALKDAYHSLSKLRGEQGPSISVVNMVYVNLVYPENPRAVLRDYFANELRIELLDRADHVHEVMLSWREDDSVDLRLHLQAVTAQVGGQERSGFRLATAGGIKLDAQRDAAGALGTIHDRLQHFFRDLLSARAKAEWGMREVV